MCFVLLFKHSSNSLFTSTTIMSWTIRKLLTGTVGRKILGNTPSISSNRGSLGLYWPEKYVAKQKPISSIRLFHIGSTYCAKKYVEIENDNARSYLQSNALYSSTLVKTMDLRTDIKGDSLNDILNQDWRCRATNEVFDAFRTVSILSEQFSLDVNSPTLENLCSAVLDNCDRFVDSQILDLLQCLTLWPPPETSTFGQFYSLWSALDQVCLSRAKTWNIDMKLLVIDHWACLNLARLSKFVKWSLKKIGGKLPRLSPRQFVQLMFYINLCRQLPPSASKFELEYTFESLGDKLTLEELSIVSMGFFKSQTPIKSQRIMERILSCLESSFRYEDPPPPDSIMLASLLKVLRTCISPTEYGKLHCILDAMLPHIKNFSLLCCLHVALIGSNIQLIHEGVMNSLCERFVAEVKNCRLKDFERLAFILTLYNYDSKTNPSIYDAMVSEIHERVTERERDGSKWEEIEKHGKCLLRFLSFLTYRQIFPLDLIEKAMDPDYIKKVYGEYWGNMGRELLILDTSLEMHFPEKIKIRLSPKIRQTLSKKFQRDSEELEGGKKLTAAGRLHVDVLENIRSLSGSPDRVFLHYILPPFEQPEIVFCLGQNKIFQKASLYKYSHNALQRCPIDSGIWHAVLTGGPNSFLKISNKPVGSLVYKMSLLEKLGYKPILVPWYEWKAAGNDKKGSYLREKIFNSMPNDSEVGLGTH